jgi:hypothetical protein
LIGGARSAVPTSNAAVGMAEHAPCPTNHASAAFAHPTMPHAWGDKGPTRQLTSFMESMLW